MKHVLNEKSSDASIYDIYETTHKDNEKIKNQLVEMKENNFKFIMDKMNLFSFIKEYKENNPNFEDDMIKKGNYYKYEFEKNRRRLVIYIPDKDELHYFSVYVLN